MRRWLMACVVVLLGPMLMAATGDPALFKREYEADAVQRVGIRARVGKIVVQPSTDGAVHLSVTLASRDQSRLAGCVATATLDDAGMPGELRLSVTQRQRERCAEQWVVRMPTRATLDLRIDVGDLVVEGMAFGGDVNVQAAVGRVTVAVDGVAIVPSRSGPGQRVEMNGEAGPALRLRSGVGDVRVRLTR